MPESLPPRPNLDKLKKQAKALLRSHKNGDAAACDSFRLIHRYSGSTADEILAAPMSLHDAQFAVSLRYGFESWKALKEHVELMQDEAAISKGEGNVENPASEDKAEIAAEIEKLIAEKTQLQELINDRTIALIAQMANSGEPIAGEAAMDLEVGITCTFGTAELSEEELRGMGAGSIIPLDVKKGDPSIVSVENRPVWQAIPGAIKNRCAIKIARMIGWEDRDSNEPLQLRVELGQAKAKLGNLKEGSIVELEMPTNEPLDININDELVAKGEVVALEERFGVRVTEIDKRNVP